MNNQDNWIKKWSSWEYHFERIRTDEEMTAANKAKILSGFKALREIMGDEWWRNAVRLRYPIFHRIMNLIPSSQLSVAKVGHELNSLKGSKNFKLLQKRLGIKDQYFNTEIELEVAWCFKNAGFEVEFYPKVGEKEADLRVILNRNEYYIEVTVVADAKQAQRASETLDKFTWPYISENDIAFTGRIYKVLSSSHILELRNRLNLAIEEVKNSHECKEVIEEGVLEFFIAPREKTIEFKSWQETRRVSGLMGPPIDVDEISRIRQRLESKNRQLPKNKPGIIVLYAESMTSQFFETDYYQRLINQVEETIYDQDNLVIGAIIAHSPDTSKEKQKISSKDFPSYQLFSNSRGKDVLIIRNKYSKFDINEAVAAALVL